MSECCNAVFGAEVPRLRTSRGPVWVVASASCIPADLRRAAFAERSKDFRYYEVIEESLREQFDCRCFVLHDETSGEWALQPFFFVTQDALAGLPAAARALFVPIRKLWPAFLKF